MPLPVQQPDFSALPAGFQGWTLGQQWDMARQNNALNQQSSLQDLMYNQQMNPLNVQGKQIANASGLMGLYTEGLNQEDKLNSLNEYNMVSPEDRKRAIMSKLWADVSTNDLKQEQAALEKALQDPSPAVRAAARQLYEFSAPMLKERLAQEERLKYAQMLEDQKQKGRVALQNMRAGAATALAEAKQKATAAKDPTGLQQLAAKHMQAAALTTDPDEQMLHYNIANQAFQALQQIAISSGAAKNAGQVDIGAMQGGTIPTHPTPVPTPLPGAPTAPVPAAPTNPLGNNPAVAPSQHNNAASEIYKKAFGSYEPDKYMYRISPEGKPQRKLK